jgi:hypothetical protein
VADNGKSLKIARELLHRVITENGRTSWQKDFRDSYIKDLAKQNALSSRKLSPAIFQKSKEEIQTTIEAYDKNYKLFLSYYRLYESLGTKLIGIYHLNDIPVKDRQKFLDQQKIMSYNFGINKDWQVSEYIIKDNIAKVTLAKTAFQPINATLKRSNFDDDVIWIAIKETATKVLHTGENLLEVRATITAERRSIVTISIDLKQNVIEIGNDLFQSDQEGNRITNEARDNDRKSVLRVLGEYLEISQAGTQELIGTLSDTNPVVSRKTEEELHGTQDEAILVVRVMSKYHVKNIDEDRLSEDAEISMPNQKLHDIMKSAGVFYDMNGTFEGFFSEHPEHKTDEATYTQQLTSTGADIFIAKAYALIVRNAHDFEKSPFEGAMKGKVIDYITYYLDMHRGEVEIKNGNYSEQAQRTFLDRIVQIDRQTRTKRSPSRKIAKSVSEKPKGKDRNKS